MNFELLIPVFYQIFLASPLILTLVFLIMFIYTFLYHQTDNQMYLEKFGIGVVCSLSIIILNAFAPRGGVFNHLFSTLNPYLFFIQTVICLFYILNLEDEVDSYRKVKKEDKKKKDSYFDKVKQLSYLPTLMIILSFLQSVTFLFN